jgi:ArsR family transcriptional regulator
MNLPVITKNMSDDELDELVTKATNASAFLKAISHEGRLMILCHLVSGEKSVTELEDLISARQAACLTATIKAPIRGPGNTKA